jgi:DNA-binding transcriptional LysR family regulator
MQLSDRIGRRMKLQDLHVLMSVVQAGSMGKAAERLRTSQPNVSRAIADLENALGVRLLDRHRQGVEPTAYGRALLEGGVAVFDELRQTVKNIESLADPTAGEVRIGTIPPIAASFGSAVVERLGRHYPRIVCNLVTAQTEDLHRDLVDRSVDLLIARKFGALADERLDFEALFDDAYVVVVGAHSRWARRRGVALADLVDAAWALPEPASVPSVVLKDALRAAGLPYPRAVVVTNSAEVRMNLLATGRYLTVFSTSALRFSAGRRAFKVLPIDLPAGRVPVGIVTLKHRTLSPTVKLFIEQAREIANPLTKGR